MIKTKAFLKYVVSIVFVFSIVFSAMGAFANAPTNGLVSYWSFDEESGTEAADLSGNNDATLEDGTSWTSGNIHNALSFDGSPSAYASVSSSSDLNFGNSTDFSVAMWVKMDDPDSSTYSFLVSKTDDSSPDISGFDIGYYGGHSEGPLFAQIKGGVGTGGWEVIPGTVHCVVNGGGTAIKDGQWHQVTVVFERYSGCDNEHTLIYVDGQADIDTQGLENFGPATLDQNISNSEPLLFGARTSGGDLEHFLDGSLDEVRIYNRALSQEEVLDIYNDTGVEIIPADIVAPVITLIGEDTIEITVGGSFNDPGATALDDVEGDISVDIVVGGDVVDVNTVGVYTITYNVSDAAGNLATEVTRIVNVNSAPLPPPPAPATLSSIAITTPATKLSYTVGDALDLAGLVVTGTYSDASTQIEIITAGNITGFDSSVPAIGKVLTITVSGQTTTYTINVNAVPIPPAPSGGGGGRSGGGRSRSPSTKPTPLNSLASVASAVPVIPIVPAVSNSCAPGNLFNPMTGEKCAGSSTSGEIIKTISFVFSDYLSFGMSGTAVKELQERLRTEGLFDYPTSTGYFGPITFASVKAYQRAHSIPATGFIGPLTLASLNK